MNEKVNIQKNSEIVLLFYHYLLGAYNFEKRNKIQRKFLCAEFAATRFLQLVTMFAVACITKFLYNACADEYPMNTNKPIEN